MAAYSTIFRHSSSLEKDRNLPILAIHFDDLLGHQGSDNRLNVWIGSMIDFLQNHFQRTNVADLKPSPLQIRRKGHHQFATIGLARRNGRLQHAVPWHQRFKLVFVVPDRLAFRADVDVNSLSSRRDLDKAHRQSAVRADASVLLAGLRPTNKLIDSFFRERTFERRNLQGHSTAAAADPTMLI